MALPSITDLKMWVGTLFTKDDWDYNFSQIVSWFADGTSDIVVNSIKSTNGIDMDGSTLSNLGAATTGSEAVNLDQALTLLNRTSYYYPFSVASGKVDSNGDAAYLQKDSDTQITVLAGNVNPDLVCIQSDGTVESVTSNTVLTVPVTDGTYYIIKEKEEEITITTGSANKVSVGKTFPTSQNTGDYFLDISVIPYKGYKYGVSGWDEVPFCYLGYVTVTSGTATITQFPYNANMECDGQWVNANVTLSSATSPSTYTIDVSSYLPDDGYNYDLLLESYMSSDGNATSVLLSSSIINHNVQIGHTEGSSDSSQNTFIFPIGTNRKLTYIIGGQSIESSGKLILHGYRRIGTNN